VGVAMAAEEVEEVREDVLLDLDEMPGADADL
jgi:hypothetical protein